MLSGVSYIAELADVISVYKGSFDDKKNITQNVYLLLTFIMG